MIQRITKQILDKRNRLTKDEIIRVFCFDRWVYPEEPSYYFDLWESYLRDGDRGHYPWDQRKYLQQKESDMWNAKCIHRFYCKVCGMVSQLEINWI